MQRHQLEVALRAAAEVAKQGELLLVGSQTVHAYTQEPPAEVLISEECDVCPRSGTGSLEILTAALGKNSPFHLANGFFVDPIQRGVLLLPNGWESRLTPMRLGKITVWCLDVNDLVVSKLNAGRLKDYEFIQALLRTRLAQFDEVVRRIATFLDPHQQAVLLARLRIASEATP